MNCTIMNKLFYYFSLLFITLSLIIIFISIFKIEILINLDYLSYMYIIVFSMFFLSMFSISKKELNKENLKGTKMLNIAGYIGLFYGVFLIYNIFEGDVFLKNGNFYQINGRNSFAIDRVVFLKKFRIQTIENSSRIMFFSYAVFLINFLIIKDKKSNICEK
jgi:hypothetical protein